MFLSFIFVAKILCFSWKICLVKQVSLNPGKNFRYLTNCNKYILSVLSCSRRGGRSFYQDGVGGDVKKNCKKNTISRVSHHEIIHFVFWKFIIFNCDSLITQSDLRKLSELNTFPFRKWGQMELSGQSVSWKDWQNIFRLFFLKKILENLWKCKYAYSSC